MAVIASGGNLVPPYPPASLSLPILGEESPKIYPWGARVSSTPSRGRVRCGIPGCHHPLSSHVLPQAPPSFVISGGGCCAGSFWGSVFPPSSSNTQMRSVLVHCWLILNVMARNWRRKMEQLEDKSSQAAISNFKLVCPLLWRT